MSEHDEDEFLPELHRPRIAALIVRYLLHHITRTERKIMAAIDDLNAKVDEVQVDVVNVQATVDVLRAAQGTPDEAIAAVTAKLQPIADALVSIVNGPATPPPPEG